MTVTLRDLAAQIGVSAMAVSMALRNHPRVSLELRERVQALARARGYVPNPAWSRRSARRRRGSAAPMPAALIVQLNPIWPYIPASFVEPLTSAGRRLGYRLNVYCQDESLPPDRLARLLWQTGTEAVLLGPIFDDRFLELLPWNQTSVVAVGAGHYVPPCHWVTHDLGRALWNLVVCCLERGYRRLALLQYKEPRGPADVFERDGAIRLCENEVARGGGKMAVFNARPREETSVVEPLRRFHPDAVVGQTSAFYYALRSCNWPFGSRCGFAAWMLTPDESSRELSGADERKNPLADYAFRLLDSEVRAFERGRPAFPVKQLVPMPWIEGRTLPLKRDLRKSHPVSAG